MPQAQPRPADPVQETPLPKRAEADDVFPPIFARIAEGTIGREKTRILPHEQVGWLREAGFGALRIPREYGGYGLDERAAFALLIDLAAADPSVAHLFRGHIAVVEEQLSSPPGPVRDKWLARFGRGEIVGNATSEPGTPVLGRRGTELSQDQTGRWSVSGEKYYSTGTIFADWIDSSVTRISEGQAEQASVLVRRDQSTVRVEDDWDGFGQRLTGTGTTLFLSAPVEAEDIRLRSQRLPWLTGVYQIVLLSVLAGIAQSLVTEAATALQRRARVYTHGNGDLARDDPQLLQIVGEIAAQAHAARVLVEDAASRLTPLSVLVQQGQSQRAADLAVPLEIAVNKAQLVVGDLVPRAATRLFDALGASAVREGEALDRHWRNARTVVSHNPLAYRARDVGNYLVNGVAPLMSWSVGSRQQP